MLNLNITITGRNKQDVLKSLELIRQAIDDDGFVNVSTYEIDADLGHAPEGLKYTLTGKDED